MEPTVNRSQQTNPHAIPWHLVGVFLLLAAGLSGAGYWHYGGHKAHIRKVKGDELSSIADLKVGELSRWRKDAVADAEVISSSVFISRQVKGFFENPPGSHFREECRSWLNSLPSLACSEGGVASIGNANRIETNSDAVPSFKRARSLERKVGT